jgi:hypothetical protein
MAASSTYTPIETQVLSSAVATITLGSGGTIPQTYTDLVLICNVKGDNANGTMQMQFNGDTGVSYTGLRVYGYTSGVGTDGGGAVVSNQLEDEGGFFTSQFTVCRANIMNYTSTQMCKSILNRGDETYNVAMNYANLWGQVDPITSIRIFCVTGNMVAGSSFTLYGIKAA